MHLFISPHFDDAVLSCGGTIHQLTQRGETVTIITVMAGGLPDPLPDTPIIRDLHTRWQAGHDPIAARREEDIAAAERLGAAVRHLDIGDCVYRTVDGSALYPSEESLFGEIQPDDPAISALEKMSLPNSAPLTVYIPLGVGHHVDHQIVRNWGLGLLDGEPAYEIRFYEEYPYTKDQQAIGEALAFFARPLVQQDTQLTAADITAKIEAVGCYTSQISTFWDNIAAMARDIQTNMAHDQDGNPVERCRIAPPVYSR